MHSSQPTQTHRTLTEKDFEVLELIAKGYTDKVIGKHLFITENSVKGRITVVLRKLNACNRAHAVHLAHELGYFDKSPKLPEAAVPHILALWNLLRRQAHIQDPQSGPMQPKTPTGGVR